MKSVLICCLAVTISLCATAQSETLQAFDATIQLTTASTFKDNSATLTIGMNGRRIPVSFTAGLGYMELDEDYKKLHLPSSCFLTLNVTSMLRLAHIRYRSTDFNIYGSVNTTKHNKVFFEYGGKIGILANDRTRLYVFSGYRFCHYGVTKRQQIVDAVRVQQQQKVYGVMVYGITFALLFCNGYSGYDFY